MSSQIEPAGKPAPSTDANEWATRANQAARSVTRSFGRRLFFLPGTHIGAVSLPSNRRTSLSGPWHYWWQAHYVDCLVDAGRRELASKTRFDGDSRPSAGRLASRLVTTIRLRNLMRFVNDYYDDMAWLALATLRLEKLAEESKKPGRRRNAYIRKSLTLQFDSASTDDFGGGTFWSTKRDFKNTPATAPVALYYARTEHTERAQQLVNWLNNKLLHPERGVYQDGIRISQGELVVDQAVYTYNQGPVLGALLELGGDDNLRRAALLVDAVRRELTLPGTQVIRGDGTGDGGLFTGILLRYLALAARDTRVPAATRETAKSLVRSTAEAFWEGRREEPNPDNAQKATPAIVFSFDPQRPASETYPVGAAVELSTQLQAWMALEAAATL
ncbi:glycoside hydrolase family 76 protein [Paenarthrobacter nitroguajacolicus]|uniref:glycoside hydrolase family 76 protein n=1 Tax=Paenarthrobacter nitroguajacolicus TaxID=211146 RepID=UPI004053E976